MLIRCTTFVTAAAAIALGGTAALAAEAKDMVGTWKWTDYTVEVKECTTNPADSGLCATVTGGPKNVGMEMIRSKLEPKDGFFTGKVAHPASGEIYNTKLMLKDPDAWSMDGCTDANVCAKGDFVRVK
jgi:uncharacterized protein (DUF2147 family)